MQNTNKNNTSSKSTQNKTSSKSSGSQVSNKTNQMKANPDKRERRDGPGGE